MKKGDKIFILDDDLKGKILSIRGEKIEIEDEYGFTHWVHQSRLVLQNKAFYEEVSVVRKQENRRVTKKIKKNQFKLDLHFEQLVKFPEQYEPWERSLIQKEKLIETLEYCKANSIKNLLIIHGLGKGILQELVYDVLRGYTNIEYEENEFFKHSSASVEIKFI